MHRLGRQPTEHLERVAVVERQVWVSQVWLHAFTLACVTPSTCAAGGGSGRGRARGCLARLRAHRYVGEGAGRDPSFPCPHGLERTVLVKLEASVEPRVALVRGLLESVIDLGL